MLQGRPLGAMIEGAVAAQHRLSPVPSAHPVIGRGITVANVLEPRRGVMG